MFRIGRRELNTFEVAVDRGFNGPAETARARSVMVQAGRPVFAFGGVDVNDAPLDTVVNIDPDGRPDQRDRAGHPGGGDDPRARPG